MWSGASEWFVDGWSGEARLTVFELLQEVLDAFFAFDGGESVFERVVVEDGAGCCVGGFLLQYGGAQTVQCGGFVVCVCSGAGRVGFAEGAGAAMLGTIALSAGLGR